MSSRPKVEYTTRPRGTARDSNRGEPILAKTLLGRGDGGSKRETVQLFVLDKTVKV